MGKLTATVGIGQSAWDTLFDNTTKSSDDLTEGSSNLYDTGTPPTTTDDLAEGSTNLYEQGDMTATEIQTAIEGMTWADRHIVVTEPVTGEHQVKGIHRNAAGELEYDYEETAES